MKDKFKKILEVAENTIKVYEEQSLKTYPLFAQNTPDLLELAQKYWLSQYRDDDTDDLGYKKVFYNINNLPTLTANKMLNIDTKDFLFVAEAYTSPWATWLLEKEFKFWMKDNYFSRTIDEITFEWVKTGNVFLKNVRGTIQVVPIENMIFLPDAMNIYTTPLLEKHEYTADELEYVGKERGWKDIDKVITKGNTKERDDNEKDKYEIYEILIPNQKKDNYVIASLDSGVILASDTRKVEDVYKHLQFEKINGRLLGRGYVEMLFEPQIYLNRIANYKSEGLHWTSKHFFQTRDHTIMSNLMTDSKNGDIFTVNSELTPVSTEERNLSVYAQEEGKWMENAMNMTFTREPITGGRAPAGTPLGSTIIQQQMASGFFNQKKDAIASLLKEVVFEWILPSFKNTARKEHKLLMKTILEGGDEQAQKFFNLKLNERMNTLRANETRYLAPDQWRIRRSIQAEMLKSAKLDIPRGYYDNIKMKLDLVISGESYNVAQKQATYSQATMMLSQNPTITQNPITKRLFFKMLELSGINPVDLGMVQDDNSMENALNNSRAQMGGSVAAPKMPQAPTLQPTQQTV